LLSTGNAEEPEIGMESEMPPVLQILCYTV
jgi:hypothetical protein